MPVTVAKLSYFKFVAAKLQLFLKAYQSDHPLVPFMYHDLKRLVKTLMELCVRPEVLGKCKTAKDFQNSKVKKLKEDGLRFVLGLLKICFEKSSLNSEIV